MVDPGPVANTDGESGRTETTRPLVVIGAGPAGLSLGYELLRSGLDFLILEQADTPGFSWSRMPRNMTLNSPWKVSCLPGTRYRRRDANRLFPRSEFYDYLQRYAKDGGLPVRTRTTVRAVRVAPGGGFLVQTDSGDFRCSTVVNATGYYGNPLFPDYPGSTDSRIPRIHAGQYLDPATTKRLLGRENARVLIVGKRISAGQIAVELHDAGSHVTISHRSPILFGHPPWMVRLAFRYYYLTEGMLLRYTRYNKEDSFGRMEGGRVRTLIESGQIVSVPDIEQFQEHSIRFTNGIEGTFDLVMWATGFRPLLTHLEPLLSIDGRTGKPPLKAFESTEVPGLYFIGLDQQRDFTSRMLRGIRRDARGLATLLRSRSHER